MKILILKSFGIGNVVMCTPMIRELHIAGHEVHLLCDTSSFGGPTPELLEGWERIEAIYSFNRDKQKDVNDLVRMLEREKFDLVVQSFPADSTFDWVFQHVKCPVRRALHVSGFWDRHEVEYNFDLVRDLIREEPSPNYEIPPRASGRINQLIPVNQGEILVAICPSFKREGLWWKKDWGAENYAELVTLLPPNFKVVLLESKAGIDSCNLIKFIGGDRVINLAGMTNIQETVAALSRVDLVIANDSGPAHLAAALDKPLMVLWGPTSEIKNKPVSDKAFILKVDIECAPCQGTENWKKCLQPVCLSSIKPAMVVDVMKKYFLEEIK